MYQALYRKWRSKTFDEVIGQEHITEILKRQLVSGRLSHAYLFVGTRGTGKTSCAKILSRAVNCEHPENGNPCNECTSCRGIESGAILDVLELDAASNNGVDNIRALRDEAIYTPASVKKRVYIIDEVHMLSTAAFNALLKILEEPPEHLIFILATTEVHKVPATILSRCQRFSFKRISPENIAARLTEVSEAEGLELSQDAAELLSMLADGSMRDALSLLDQCASSEKIDLKHVTDTIGLVGNTDAVRLFDAVCDSDVKTALAITDLLYKDGKEMGSILDELTLLARDILVVSLIPTGGAGLLSGAFDKNTLSRLKKKIGPERIYFFIDTLRAQAQTLSRASSRKLGVELCIILLCGEKLSDSASALVARIEKLEKAFIYGAAMTAPDAQSEPEPDIAEEEVPDSGIFEPEEESVLLPEPEYEPEPVPEPEPMPEEPAGAIEIIEEVPPEDETQEDETQEDETPEPDSGGFWEKTLAFLKNDPAIYNIVCDDRSIAAELSGSILTVRATNLFAFDSVSKPGIKEQLKKAAEEIHGGVLSIKIVMSEPEPPKSSTKLDRLKEYDIFQYE